MGVHVGQGTRVGDALVAEDLDQPGEQEGRIARADRLSHTVPLRPLLPGQQVVLIDRLSAHFKYNSSYIHLLCPK